MLPISGLPYVLVLHVIKFQIIITMVYSKPSLRLILHFSYFHAYLGDYVQISCLKVTHTDISSPFVKDEHIVYSDS